MNIKSHTQTNLSQPSQKRRANAPAAPAQPVDQVILSNPSQEPPQLLTPAEVARVFGRYQSALDTAAGAKDGKFGAADLEKVAHDPKTPRALREAAQATLDDPNIYRALDGANGGALDDQISSRDLKTVQANAEIHAAQLGARELAKKLDTRVDSKDSKTYFQALAHQVEKNGKVSYSLNRADLERALSDPATPAAQKELAQQLLDSPEGWDALAYASDAKSSKEITQSGIGNVKMMPEAQKAQDLWNDQKDRDLDKALHDPNLGDGDLFKGFHQTSKGNCATTAIIKAAMDHFDNQIFNSVKRNQDGSYQVELQDGSQVTVSRAELSEASAGAQYKGSSPETMAYANLIYAVMAKRAQEMNHEGAHTFGEALASLANGEGPNKTVQFIGLEGRVRSLSPDQIEGADGVVAWGHGHCIYVDTLAGKTYGDAWGKQNEYNGTNRAGRIYTSDQERQAYAIDGAFTFV